MSDDTISPAETTSTPPQTAPAAPAVPTPLLMRHFQPKPDITALELAEVVFRLGIVFPAPVVSLALERHFTEPK